MAWGASARAFSASVAASSTSKKDRSCGVEYEQEQRAVIFGVG